jgi:hypothetical protein
MSRRLWDGALARSGGTRLEAEERGKISAGSKNKIKVFLAFAITMTFVCR